MSLPPGLLTKRLTRAFPQFILCDAALDAQLVAFLDPSRNQPASDLVQWLQENPAAAEAAGKVLRPSGAPATSAVPLDSALVAALAPLLFATSSWIVAQDAFKGVAWTQQNGVAPGPVTPSAATDSWTLPAQGPMGGLLIENIAWSGDAARNFNLTLLNNAPRHLAVYAAFTSGGAPTPPAGWTSRLPSGAPSGFETDTVKFLGVLAPNVAVGAIPAPAAAQSVVFALPANVDGAQVMFGGLNANSLRPIPDAAGLLLTFVLDVFAPWVLATAEATGDLASWYASIATDPDIVAGVLAGGSSLLGAANPDAIFAALSANMTALLLSEPLSGLRDAITAIAGSPMSADYTWVDQLAPAAGWAAQLARAFLAGGVAAPYWSAAAPAIPIDVSPGTALALDATLSPDPVSGVWPYEATRYEVEIAYGRGYTQKLNGVAPKLPGGAPILATFGAVANVGPVDVAATIRDAAGNVLAQASGHFPPPPPFARRVSAPLSLRNLAVPLNAPTRYRCVARLAYANGSYAWDASASGASPSTVAASWQDAPMRSALTLQADALCLGYAWGAVNQQTTACGNGAPLSTAFFVQNIGTATPAAELRTLNCGLVAAPQLAYAAIAGDGAAMGCYVDTQGAGVFLRPVAFGSGTFDLSPGTSLAQLPAQSGPLAVSLHPAGYAAAVNASLNILQIVKLAARPGPDGSAPAAAVFCGGGARVGLLATPIAIAATPSGALLVLEQGNARVQAFDIYGNPLPIFARQPVLALRGGPSAVYNDLAVSPHGFIFVLGAQKSGATLSDFFLDIYNPDGSLLSTTMGVAAARLAVDAEHTLFTLDFASFAGLNGRTEPQLSIWRPHS